jgi:hypothetical protein
VSQASVHPVEEWQTLSHMPAVPEYRDIPKGTTPTAEHAATGLKKSTISTRFYQLISPISGGLDLVRAESQELTTFSRNCQVCTIP